MSLRLFNLTKENILFLVSSLILSYMILHYNFPTKTNNFYLYWLLLTVFLYCFFVYVSNDDIKENYENGISEEVSFEIKSIEDIPTETTSDSTTGLSGVDDLGLSGLSGFDDLGLSGEGDLGMSGLSGLDDLVLSGLSGEDDLGLSGLSGLSGEDDLGLSGESDLGMSGLSGEGETGKGILSGIGSILSGIGGGSKEEKEKAKEKTEKKPDVNDLLFDNGICGNTKTGDAIGPLNINISYNGAQVSQPDGSMLPYGGGFGDDLGKYNYKSRVYNNDQWMNTWLSDNYGRLAWTNKPDYYIPEKKEDTVIQRPHESNQVQYDASKNKEKCTVCPVQLNNPWTEYKTGDNEPEGFNLK